MWLLDAANNRYGSTNKRGDVGAFGDIERCGNAALTVENVFYRDVLTVDAQEISKPLADQVAAAQVWPSSTPLPGRRACVEQSAVVLDTARTEELTGTDWGGP